MLLYDAGLFAQAAEKLGCVFKSCTNSYAVVLALLESEIQSGSAALLSEGMKLMKTLLQHATQYEVESRGGWWRYPQSPSRRRSVRPSPTPSTRRCCPVCST